jgi:hypothetical protein
MISAPPVLALISIVTLLLLAPPDSVGMPEKKQARVLSSELSDQIRQFAETSRATAKPAVLYIIRGDTTATVSQYRPNDATNRTHDESVESTNKALQGSANPVIAFAEGFYNLQSELLAFQDLVDRADIRIRPFDFRKKFIDCHNNSTVYIPEFTGTIPALLAHIVKHNITFSLVHIVDTVTDTQYIDIIPLVGSLRPTSQKMDSGLDEAELESLILKSDFSTTMGVLTAYQKSVLLGIDYEWIGRLCKATDSQEPSSLVWLPAASLAFATCEINPLSEDLCQGNAAALLRSYAARDSTAPEMAIICLSSFVRSGLMPVEAFRSACDRLVATTSGTLIKVPLNGLDRSK